MSFVDLMANDDWSDADIKTRSEAIIAAEFSPMDYAILSRKLQGQAFGYVLSAEEQAQLDRYRALSFEAGAQADAARADMAALRQAWAVEAGQADNATPETLALVERRGRAFNSPNPP